MSERVGSTTAMAPSSKKMVVGFNHNIKHAGKVYHVQTEDSGIDNPHVITHLFAGGNILSSKRASYKQLLGREDLELQVRILMEAQHKEMLRNLIGGAFDKQEAQVAGRAYQPGEIAPLSPAPTVGALALTEAGVGSIFAEDLESEKSLDEVILSYLAGEIDS